MTSLMLTFIKRGRIASGMVVSFEVRSAFQFQVSARAPDICKARSSTAKCSSAPSTRRLSTSEN